MARHATARNATGSAASEDAAAMAASRLFHKNLMDDSYTDNPLPPPSSKYEHDLPPPARPMHQPSSLPTVDPPPAPTTTAPLGALDATLPRYKKDSSGVRTGKQPPPTPLELFLKTPQDIQRSWKVEASFDNTLFFLVKHGWLEPHLDDQLDAAQVLSSMSPEYAAIIEYVPILQGIDFSALKDPDPNYATRKEISKNLVWLMAACAVHYDLNFGLVLR